MKLAEKYGTPLYVYSETEIVSNINELKDSFIRKYKYTRVAYASKTFNVKAILKLYLEYLYRLF